MSESGPVELPEQQEAAVIGGFLPSLGPGSGLESQDRALCSCTSSSRWQGPLAIFLCQVEMYWVDLGHSQGCPVYRSMMGWPVVWAAPAGT